MFGVGCSRKVEILYVLMSYCILKEIGTGFANTGLLSYVTLHILHFLEFLQLLKKLKCFHHNYRFYFMIGCTSEYSRLQIALTICIAYLCFLKS